MSTVSPPHATADSDEEEQQVQTSQMNRLSCLRCKSSKLRCDRRLPSCTRCTQYDKECVFPRQRVSHMGKKKQVRDLDAKLAQLESQFKDLTRKYDLLDGSGSVAPEEARFEQTHHYPSPASRVSGLSRNHATSPVFASTETDESSEVSGGLPPSHVREELTEIYFERLHYACPIIHPQRYRDSLRGDSAHQPPACLQLIIMALAATIYPPFDSDAIRLYTMARSAAEADEMRDQGQHFMTRAHIQTWLLIANFEAQHAMFTRASTSCSQGIRMAQILGFHQLQSSCPMDRPTAPPSDDPVGDWVDAEESRRTWWAAFVSDRLVLATTGIPVMINIKDVTTALPAPEEAFENRRPQHNNSFHMELKQPTQNISIFAARVLASELFYRPLSTMSGPSCIFPELCDPDHDHYRSRHREIETGLVLLSAALPPSIRLPLAAHDQNAIFVNVLLQTATICLHKTLLKHGTCAVCAVDDAVARRSRDRVVAAAHETMHIFSLARDLPVALRNPTLCFAAYTAGLVCCEMAVRGGDPNGLDNVRFLVNMLNAVGPTNVVAGMLASQLAQHAQSMGLGLAGANMSAALDGSAANVSVLHSIEFAGQLASHFTGTSPFSEGQESLV